MAAEIIEEEYVDPDTLQDLPTEEHQMSQDDLGESLDTTVETEPPVEDELPEKYQGKSIKEVVSMHQEAERLIGTQGSEVGELRKVVDTYIASQTSQQFAQEPETEEEELDDSDFFTDPKAAVSKAISSHPEIRAAKEASAETMRRDSLVQLREKHPDTPAVLQNPAFVEWIKGSPVRQELFARADQFYDFNAADELISNFKERNQAVQQTLDTEKASRQTAVNTASTGTSSGATGASGQGRKIYRRADIIKLMKTDPDRYDQLAPEITLAYQEGRVK